MDNKTTGSSFTATAQTERSKHSAAVQAKQRATLWLYVVVGSITLMGLVSVVALVYGFMAAETSPTGERLMQFPVLSWLGGMICVPSLLILLVHRAGVGLFERSSRQEEEEQQWQERLPERLQKVYVFLKGAPVVVLLLMLGIAGGALFTVDGMLGAFVRVVSYFAPYIPYIVVSLAIVICCFVVSIAWFRLRSRQLMEEYAFRREIFERSGIVITDKQTMALPLASSIDGQSGAHAIASTGHRSTTALPIYTAQAVEVSEVELAENITEVDEEHSAS